MQFSLLDYNTLSPVNPSVASRGEIYDATLSSSHVRQPFTALRFLLETISFQFFLATSSEILVYALPAHANGEKDGGATKDAIPQSTSDDSQLNKIKSIELPPIPGVPSGSNITFRAAR